MQKKKLQKAEKGKKRQIRKGRKKKEEKKKPTLSILILKKPLFLVGLLCYSSIGVGNRLGVFIDLHFRFVFSSLPLPLSSSLWFDAGVLALLGFCSFFFALL